MLRAILTVIHVILGVAAIGAGQALCRRPDGEALGLEKEWLEGSPFPDYRVPGAFLAVVIGGANLAAGHGQWHRKAWAPQASAAAGALMVVWQAIQTAIIGYRHWSQALWAVTFTSTLLMGLAQVSRKVRPSKTESRLDSTGESYSS